MTSPKAAAVIRLAYSVSETAQALSISIPTLHRAISHKLLRSTKLGRVIRIPAAEVERVAVEGLPPIPRTYLRKTVGPTTRGRPRKVAKPLAPKPSRRRKASRSAEQAAL